MLDVVSVLDLQSRRYSGLVRGAVVAIATATISFLGLLAPIENGLFDRFLGVAAFVRPPEQRVFLVEADPETFDDNETCVRLIELLEELGARDILLLSLPRAPDRRFFERLARSSLVVLGVGAEPDPADRNLWTLDPLPDSAGNLAITTAVARLDPGENGVHRRHRVWYRTVASLRPAIESSVLPESELDELLGTDGRIRLCFSGGAGSLPASSAIRILENRLVPELVSGKSVLIGRVRGDEPPEIDTPTTSSDEKMTRLEYHGHALNTLLSQRAIRTTSPLVFLALLLAFNLSTGLALQWVDARAAVWIAAGAISVSLALSGYALLFHDTWLPAAELSMSLCVLLFATLYSKSLRSTVWLQTLLVRTSSKFDRQKTSDRIDPAGDAWGFVVNLVHQTLDLNRSLFFEKIRGKSSLANAIAVNCSFDDVLERRRDPLRAPFLTATDIGGPVRLESFLKKSSEKEEQFLVPLSFAGETLGFWALSADPQKIGGSRSFDDVLANFATLISELLFKLRQATTSDSLLHRLDVYLTHDAAAGTYERLKDMVGRVESRNRQLDVLLSEITTALVVYDLFGRVSFINDRMLQLLESEHLSADKLNALDLVTALTEFDLGKSRRILRLVLIEGQTVTLPVTLSSARDRRHVLHLHPVQLASNDGTESALESLSGRGILCEIVDASSLSTVFEMKEKLASRLGLQLRNDLASIDISASLLESRRIGEDSRRHVAQLVHEKVTETLHSIVECQRFLSLDNESRSLECFPVDPGDPFESALLELKGNVRGRSVAVSVEKPRLLRYVLAHSENLEAVCLSILQLLAADAIDNSTIQVRIAESESMLSFAFENTGFGIPNQRLQTFLREDATLASPEQRRLKESISLVESWGGELEATSEVGVGFRVELRLIKFF
jgi:CHASE2 domain-containing sensor protein/signal transduction histidine kinase